MSRKGNCSQSVPLADMNEGRITTRRRSSMLQDFQPGNDSPFNRLPNEVVENILSYLDLKSLKASVLVDRRFNGLITQSPKIMPLLPLTVGRIKGSGNREILEFTRRYREINFDGIAANKWFKYMKEGLKSIGADVAKVNFKNCQFTVNGLKDVLSCFPNIEKLRIVSFYKSLDVKNEKPFNPNMFPKLTDVQLEFITSILKDLVPIQLKCLQILHVEGNEWNSLLDFVSNQTRLTTLTLIDSSRLPEDLQLIRTFRPELMIHTLNFLFVKNIDVDKFIEFLLLFVNSVKFLTVIRVDKTLEPHRIFESVLQNFTGLEGLAVDFDHFPTNEQFYRGLEVNNRLDSLALNCRILNNPFGFRGIFSKYPSISNLSVSISRITEEMTTEDFTFMYEKLKKLKYFYLVVHSSVDLNQEFFKAMTSLNIVTFPVAVDWASIARSSPNLKTLIISSLPYPNILDFNSLIISLKNLEQLEIGNGFTMTKSHMKIIKKHGKNLKDVKCLKSSWKMKETPAQMMTNMKIQGIQMHLQSTPYDNVSFYLNTFFFKSR